METLDPQDQSANGELEGEQQQPSASFKLYASSYRSCQLTQHHLATFNNLLTNPNHFPKVICEEQVQIKKKNARPEMIAVKDDSDGDQKETEKRFVYEERDENENLVKYYGKESTKY